MFQKAALAGVGFWASRRSVWADIKSPNEKLNLAIVGAGGQGGGNTGAVASENIVAICDVDERRAAGTLQRFPKARRYADFRKMLDEIHDQIDAVVVSTPDHTHAVATVAAMKLGKHAFCEKPLTRTVFEARVMRETAAKENVVTQMGNQGSASEGLRRGVELAWEGVVGEMREAHVWFGGGNRPQDRPKDKPPIPAGLDWDLWLGPAPYRPYHPAYAPASWRNWRAFGTGCLGDFGCHSMNLAFRGLRLDSLWNPDSSEESSSRRVVRVESEASEVHPETYSRWVIVRYQFLALGKLPPVKLTWYNGGPKPPEDLLLGHAMTDNGCLLVGSKGAIFSDCPWNTRFMLLPEKEYKGFQGPAPTLPRSPGHHAEWLRACKGGAKPFSSFAIGGPLTEVILLGIAALLVGHPIQYDTLSGKIVNRAEANRFLHREYRSGWSL
jgi:predicted dehydrogenase